MTVDDLLLDPGSVDGTLELRLTRLAQHFQAVKADLREFSMYITYGVGGGTWSRGFPPAVAAAFLEAGEPLLELCRKLTAELEWTYVTAATYLEDLERFKQREASFRRRLEDSLYFVGCAERPQTYSMMGWIEGDARWPVAVARDRGLVALVAGEPGCGKTIFSTLFAEGCLRRKPPVTSEKVLKTAFCFFHLEEHERLPQLLDGLKPNPNARDLQILRERLGLPGSGLERIRLAVPKHILPMLQERLKPYQRLGLEVVEMRIELGKLGQLGLEAALGAESGARYVGRMLEVAQQEGDALTIERWKEVIDEADDLTVSMKRSAKARLAALDRIGSKPGGPGLWDMVEPGWATVLYLGGPHMGRGERVPMLLGLLNSLMRQSEEHGEFQRVISVDEVNLLAGDEPAWQGFIRGARQVRHRGWVLLIFGQDLNCVPDELFGLAGMVAVGRLRNPRVFQVIKERTASLTGNDFGDVQHLGPSEFLLAVVDSTDPEWRGAARVIRARPPLCMHGGYTRAVL